jgi:hypothetical protein
MDGVLLDECPEGEVRPVARVEAYRLGRKDEGTVSVGVAGHYMTPWKSIDETPVRRFSAELALVGADGVEHALKPEDGWDDAWNHEQSARVKLPDVPDGDYVLRVRVDSPAGEATVDAPLPLYQPALAHVLTDAPLYKPGQDVRFRGVLLGAADLAPLEGRPAVWKVFDPSGELLLEEKAKTGPFGVVDGSFPLAGDADPGEWTVQLVSGQATDGVEVEVKPFQLPRFTVDVASEKAYWRIGESPILRGVVRYTSGAPVGDAPVRVRVRASGGWPPPRDWEEERTIQTDARGGFTVPIGVVPADLRGVATLSYTFEAVDPTGDTASGGATVLLSEDAIATDAVTELEGGLVAKANNRVYLRVTTPDGRVLPNTRVRVTREWDPSDPGTVAETDADGVARLQLDPGEPTTVVVPPMPVRPKPRAAVTPATLDTATDALAGEPLDLAGQVVMDRWTGRVASCAGRAPPGGSRTVATSVLIGSDGRARLVEALDDGDATPLAACVEDVLAGQPALGGRDRLWYISWTVNDPGTPWVEMELDTQIGQVEGLTDAVEARLANTRGCVAGVSEDLELPRAFRAGVRRGARDVSLVPLTRPGVDGVVDPAAAACVERALAGLQLDEPAETDGVGLLTFSVSVPAEERVRAAEPTTFPGFALRVEALDGERSLGSTVVRLREGAVPDLRLRPSEVLVNPGDTVELAAIRGPDFIGSFPKKLWLHQGDRRLVEFDFDPDTRKGAFKVPDDVSGFVHVELGGARAVVYVRPKSSLSLALSTDATSYRPGETARLTVSARDGDKPVAAGVTLSGVDSTLATLAPLVGPDDFARVTVRAASDRPAFGVLDARALQTGQIAGDNAAQAAVLRVTALPSIPPGADRVSIDSTRGAFTPEAELADAFYGFYREVRSAVRAWESTAAAGELLTAERMVALWEDTLSKHPTRDPFDRPLHLSALPPDLLTLTDPRFMASDGARLPEDVENWPAYVAAEAP